MKIHDGDLMPRGGMMKQGFFCGFWIVLLLSALAAEGSIYYVREDGGDATECTGLTDAAYPGSGSGLDCAWKHPFIAFPPEGSPRISGGDTLVIASGSYRMGYGAPGSDSCSAVGSYECHMPPIPSGPEATHPTRILGEGWDRGCTNPPELWGSERPWLILNLTDSSNLEIACLEITDHSSCIEHHSTASVRCERDQSPYGDWAPIGIFAEDSSHVRLADVSVHGLASDGIHAGRLSDWTVERVRISGNGWAGWDGDLWDAEGDSNTGTLLFRQVEVGYNGCAEDPDNNDDVLLPTCWAQTAGGYGDGFAAGDSGGHWIFEDCYVHHNTSDGIDLLYLNGTAETEVDGLIAEGNAGNQLKISGTARVENSVLVGNCAYFNGLSTLVDDCRAFGNALSMEFFRGGSIDLYHLSITGEGDCLSIFGCRDSSGCDGSETLTIRNTVFDGKQDFMQPWERSCLYWYDTSVLPTDPLDFDYNLVFGVKDDVCPGTHSVCGEDPLLFDGTMGTYDARLSSGSPSIGEGTGIGVPEKDILGVSRDLSPDIGAYEFGGLFGDDFEYGDVTAWSGRSW